MDSTLPQMQSFDFDRLDPIALEDTLTYLRQHPEPPAEDVALFDDYQGLLEDAVGERDWMAGPSEDMGGQSSCVPHSKKPSAIASPHIFKPIGRPEPHQDMSVLGTALGSLGTTRKQPGMISQFKSSFDRYKCTWDGCQQRSPGDKELRDHLSAHSVDALAHWACGSTCTWQGCKSKAKFKTTRQFYIHLENIHTKPLLCTRSPCTHKRPFRNKHELERHNSSKHSAGRPWECPYDYCPSETRAFARKDKWLKHIREVQHENDAFCPYLHCDSSTIRTWKGFEDRKEIATHFSLKHSRGVLDEYGCALGSCGNTGKRDRWDTWELIRHLQNRHKMVLSWDYPRTRLEGTDHIFRSQHIPLDFYNKWIDCEMCASHTLQTPLGNTTSTSAQFGMAPV